MIVDLPRSEAEKEKEKEERVKEEKEKQDVINTKYSNVVTTIDQPWVIESWLPRLNDLLVSGRPEELRPFAGEALRHFPTNVLFHRMSLDDLA